MVLHVVQLPSTVQVYSGGAAGNTKGNVCKLVPLSLTLTNPQPQLSKHVYKFGKQPAGSRDVASGMSHSHPKHQDNSDSPQFRGGVHALEEQLASLHFCLLDLNKQRIC